jgi:hypothetical protein
MAEKINISREHLTNMILSEKLVQRSLRYSRLVRLGAPEIILANELAMTLEVVLSQIASLSTAEHKIDGIMPFDTSTTSEGLTGSLDKYKSQYADIATADLASAYNSAIWNTCSAIIDDRSEWLVQVEEDMETDRVSQEQRKVRAKEKQRTTKLQVINGKMDGPVM